MKSVTRKSTTRRTAEAEARLEVGPGGRSAVEERSTPKGDPTEIARTAALAAIERTPELIPHCHDIPVTGCEVGFRVDGREVVVTVEVETVARTGVEMEALTGAAVAALNLYDLLKPLGEQMAVADVELLSKSGGSSDFQDSFAEGELSAAVIVASDGVAAGEKEDRSGRLLRDRLKREGFSVEEYSVIPDDRDRIRHAVLELCDEGVDFVTTTGGTGPGPRDVTVEATAEVLDREIPGIAEAMRSHGQERTPYAMFSRGLAGQRGKTLIVNFPGSSNGTRESLDGLFPGLLHFFRMRHRISGGHGNER